MSKRTLSIFAVGAALALGACEDSTTEPEVDAELTKMEAEALFLGVQGMLADTMPEIVSITAAGIVVACPLGGQAAVAIEDNQMQSGDTAITTTTTTLAPDGCVVSGAGQQFTLDGAPAVQIETTLTGVASTFMFTVEGSIAGGMDWQLDDRSGTCMVDLTFSGDLAQPEAAEVNGTLCGHGPPFASVGVLIGG